MKNVVTCIAHSVRSCHSDSGASAVQILTLVKQLFYSLRVVGDHVPALVAPARQDSANQVLTPAVSENDWVCLWVLAPRVPTIFIFQPFLKDAHEPSLTKVSRA